MPSNTTPTLDYRLLGRNSGLRVSEIALGTGKFGSAFHNGAGTDDAKAVFQAYAEAGGNFIDTAASYQGGQSEQLLGELLGADRDHFVIATKYGVGVTRNEPFDIRGNGRRAMMIDVEGSLRRLRTDHIDLYWPHGTDGVTPIAEILQGLDDLVRAGKVLHVGLGNFPAWRVSRAALLAQVKGWAPITAVTYEYGLAERDAEREILPMAEALGLGVTLWSPLGGGYLSGATNGKSGLPHWTNNARPSAHDAAVLAAATSIAGEIGAHPAQVAYAWLFNRVAASTTTLVPTVAADTVDQLHAAIAAKNLHLTATQLGVLDDVSAPPLGEPHDHNRLSEPFFNDSGTQRAHPLPTPVA